MSSPSEGSMNSIAGALLKKMQVLGALPTPKAEAAAEDPISAGPTSTIQPVASPVSRPSTQKKRTTTILSSAATPTVTSGASRAKQLLGQ